MPKRKARQVKLAVPEDDLALSKDDTNTKGSKEDRIRALELFGSDFAIQGNPVGILCVMCKQMCVFIFFIDDALF